MTHFLDTWFLYGRGYQFWSGAGSDFGELSILIAIGMFFRHRNCHVKGCWRLGHPNPDHGWPACRKHHEHKLQGR